MGTVNPSTVPGVDDPSALNIAIIGGGITGINLALGLEHRLNQNPKLTNTSNGQKRLSYTIYERAPGFREIGAGIGFSPNAERAMGLLSPDVLSSFKRIANPNGEDYFQWIDGKTDKLIFKLYCGKDGFQGGRRSDILEEWAKLIPLERVQFGKTVETVSEEEEAEKITIHFTDGSVAHADVVIGCDGIRSRIRQLVLSPSQDSIVEAAHPHYTHKFCFRSLVPMDAAIASIGEKRAMTRFMYNGPKAHIITYPVGNNSMLNVLAVISDDKPWPEENKKLTAQGSKSEATEAFKDWHETARKIVDLFPEDSEGRMEKWAVFDMAQFPADRYVSVDKGTTGKVCVAGDAAHATGPHLGAGGGLGVEDALVLSALLEDVALRLPTHAEDGKETRKKSELIRAALQVYNDVRYERTQWVVKNTRYAVDLFQWQDPVVGRDDAKFGGEITKTFHKVWEYDVEGMVQEALDGLGKKIGGR
ncbi:salicylate hydroxylase [Rhypophila decipiens]